MLRIFRGFGSAATPLISEWTFLTAGMASLESASGESLLSFRLGPLLVLSVTKVMSRVSSSSFFSSSFSFGLAALAALVAAATARAVLVADVTGAAALVAVGLG